jgi:hypothetical protein
MDSEKHINGDVVADIAPDIAGKGLVFCRSLIITK